MAFASPNWVSDDLHLGYPVPGVVDAGVVINGVTVSRIPVGTEAVFRDQSALGLGAGTFIWLPGVASTVAGDVVNYTISDGAASGGTTVRWAGTAATGVSLAVATAATVAATWGWYQVQGAALINCAGTVAANAAVYYGGTTAQIDDAQVNGKQMLNAFSASASDGGSPAKAAVTINRPFMQGQTA